MKLLLGVLVAFSLVGCDIFGRSKSVNKLILTSCSVGYLLAKNEDLVMTTKKEARGKCRAELGEVIER